MGCNDSDRELAVMNLEGIPESIDQKKFNEAFAILGIDLSNVTEMSFRPGSLVIEINTNTLKRHFVDGTHTIVIPIVTE